MRESAMESAVSRRDFLKASGGILGSMVAGPAVGAFANRRPQALRCITIFLTGGPSQLETFDPKPAAPSTIRGPFRVTRTSVPGIYLSETLPRTAQMMSRLAIIRTMHHPAAPIHETGQRLIQTGRLGRHDCEPPHLAAVMNKLQSDTAEPSFAVIPHRIRDTGVSFGHGQSASHLGPIFEPLESDALLSHPRWRTAMRPDLQLDSSSDRYGRHPLGQLCFTALRLVERGMRFVTVNMFTTVFDQVTWDCHADGGLLATTLSDYQSLLCPMFDQAFTALLDDLADRGLLDTTLVMVLSEFGRTPRINPRGGRDHWPNCWSIILAGGGVPGGQVIGRSDAWAAEPAERPVTPEELAATVLALHGFDPRQRAPGPDGTLLPLADAEPIPEIVG